VLKIIFLPTDQLVEYSNNAKEHPPEQIQQIANSIEQFGFNDPILLGKNNVILAGHGRLFSARAKGLKKVPCIQLLHLTEEQENAFRLVSNQTCLSTQFDPIKLSEELFELNLNFNMADFGFNLLNGIVTELEQKEYKESSGPKYSKDNTIACPECGAVFQNN
jgi:hypothetical protein